jgi:hypothetical protein
MKNFSQGLNGISADMLKTVTQVSIEARQKAAEQADQEKAAVADRHESFRPLAADKIEKSSRAIERLYAGMQPAYKAEQNEETIAERVAALKQPKVTVKHQPMAHDSYLLEPKVTLKGGLKRKMEAESAELTADDQSFLEQLNVEGTTPTSAKEKSLAAVAHPKDKITHKDVIVGRLKSFAKKTLEKVGGGTDADQLKRLRKNMYGEDVEQPVEESRSAGSVFDKDVAKSFQKKKPGESAGFDSKKVSTGTVYTRKEKKEDEKEVKEDIEQIEEKKLKDTPGQEHICAVHVKHSKLGEGKTLYSQHAEPDADGNIAWYDVMFEEGIVRVETTELEILEACSHGNHKK